MLSDSREQLRTLGYAVVDRIADHLAGIGDRAVFRPFPGELRDALRIPADAPATPAYVSQQPGSAIARSSLLPSVAP